MGVYVLGLTGMEGIYTEAFIKTVRALSKLMSKCLPPQQHKPLHEKIATSLAELEIRLPLFWDTMTRHQLLHAIDAILDHGAFWAIHMLNEERMHISIRKWATNQKHILGSISTNYNLHDNSQTHWRIEEDPELKWTNEPRKSTFAGSSPLPVRVDKLKTGNPKR